MPKGKPSGQRLCCGCNGPSAKCKACRCAKAGVPCVNCRAPDCNNRTNIVLQMVPSTSADEPINRVDETIPFGNGMTQNTLCTNSVFPTGGTNISEQNGNNIVSTLTGCATLSEAMSPADLFEQTCQWRPNLMTLPACSASHKFIQILTSFFADIAQSQPQSIDSLKMASVFSHLILQRIHTRKIASIRKTIERRLLLWSEKRFIELCEEAEYLQQNMRRTKPITKQDWKKRYIRMITNGKLSAAGSVLTGDYEEGVLSYDTKINGSSVKDILQSLHPKASTARPEALLQFPLHDSLRHHPVRFFELDEERIIKASLETNGSAGPSGMDANLWRSMLTKFGSHSQSLAKALAELGTHIAAESVIPGSLDAFTACRLVAIKKKNGGVRPIGICEVPRRIICKALLKIITFDLQESAGCIQLAASQKAGIEYAIRSVRDAFQAKEDHCIMAVDASNAFNAINRKAALHNIQYVCPSLYTALNNIYMRPAKLCLGGDSILSEEGFTQGDPFAMAAFSMATLPLVNEIARAVPSVLQRWFADDSNFVGTMVDLQKVWEILIRKGPIYGYHVNATKTQLLGHPSADFSTPKIAVNHSISGISILGAPVGTEKFIDDYISEKCCKWVSLLERLVSISYVDPHVAYAGFTKSFQFKWSHLLRTVQCSPSQFDSVSSTIFERLIPELTQIKVDSNWKSVLSIPIKLGGIGIMDPTHACAVEYEYSEKICKTFDYGLNVIDLCHLQKSTIHNISKMRTQAFQNKLLSTIQCMDSASSNIIAHAAMVGASTWLSALPLVKDGFHLSRNEFSDALCSRYGWTPPNVSQDKCACGTTQSVSHALSCKTGGLPIIRHNAVRDILALELSEVCHGVATEPVLAEVPETLIFEKETTSRESGARLDVVCCGMRGERFERTFIDVNVFSTLAQSNVNRSPESSFLYNESRKQSKYAERISIVEHGYFVPAIFSTSGGIGKYAMGILRDITAKRTLSNRSAYPSILSHLKRRIGFALARAVSASLRCPRSTRRHPCRQMTTIA